MFGKIVFALSALALASAQIPSFGWCPDYVPMANFDMKSFLGEWYETERYFQISEVGTRCVMTNYTQTGKNKYHVINEVVNRFTGVKRIVEGELKKADTKTNEGKFLVKYRTTPLTPEIKYNVLETDYKSYAVLWSCSSLGPVHTQNAWLMTRERNPPGEVLQKAYGVLDKYKISKTFFVKSDQEDCATLASSSPAAPEESSSESTEAITPQGEHLRSVISPDTSEVILQSNKDEDTAKLAVPVIPKVAVENVEESIVKNVEISAENSEKETVKLEQLAEKSEAKLEDKLEDEPVKKSDETLIEIPVEDVVLKVEKVPERILKVAEAVKEESVAEQLKETETKA